MPPGFSLKTTVRQELPSADGFTHASTVMPVPRCSASESGTVTHVEAPLKLSARPNLPAVVQAAFAATPLLPFPVASGMLVPLPWSNEYAATGPPPGGDAFATVTATGAEVVELPAASRATA